MSRQARPLVMKAAAAATVFPNDVLRANLYSRLQLTLLVQREMQLQRVLTFVNAASCASFMLHRLLGIRERHIGKLNINKDSVT